MDAFFPSSLSFLRSALHCSCLCIIYSMGSSPKAGAALHPFPHLQTSHGFMRNRKLLLCTQTALSTCMEMKCTIGDFCLPFWGHASYSPPQRTSLQCFLRSLLPPRYSWPAGVGFRAISSCISNEKAGEGGECEWNKLWLTLESSPQLCRNTEGVLV